MTERSAVYRWLDRHLLALGRDLRLSYLPPLMVYLAAGVSGLTAIVGTFFVKDYLGLSAAFLAELAFWAGIPWVLKMPLGHLVDLYWRWKSALVLLGAALIAASLGIMIGLVGATETMRDVLPVDVWYIISALLAPTGYVLQDVVADAMTVEAVPRSQPDGSVVDEAQQRLMHTTMQTLGRVAIIGGSVAVALVNIVLFRDAQSLSEAERVAVYTDIYQLAMIIPLTSVLGVLLAAVLRRRQARAMAAHGLSGLQIRAALDRPAARPEPNYWILGGGLAFVLFTLTLSAAQLRFDQEIIFLGSLAIVVFLMLKLVNELEPQARRVLVGTALLVFVFRALPGPGAGASWWTIDELGFDQQFLSVLALIGSSLTLFGIVIFRRFMAEKSMASLIGFLTLAGALLMLPNLSLYYGLHHWTAAHTGGLVDARFIALIDTALESPLGQIAMIPMLAWIAGSAPPNLKATYFAVMASFTNLALSLSQIGTRYLNEIFVVSREVRDVVSGELLVAADYGQLGGLLWTVAGVGLVLPFAAIAVVKLTPLASAPAARELDADQRAAAAARYTD